MTENYDHTISKNIHSYYLRKLTAPFLYLLAILLLWILCPLRAILFPAELNSDQPLKGTYSGADAYVQSTFTNLTFSGYTREWFGQTVGYYYYGTRGEQCYLLLLSPSSCEEGLPSIDRVHVTVKIIPGKENYTTLLKALSKDLHWTQEGIVSQMPNYYYSEPDYQPILTFIFFFVYFVSSAYALVSLILYLLYCRFPSLSPPVLDLAIFGSPRRLLRQAEIELATLPQLATEDMFITEHFFILTSPYGNAIVPIREILWIYKHSTLHKFLWYHFSISYTLHITANKHYYIHCPKNLKSDIDGIMDYLSEANHDILVGFSEKNRLAVQEKLGKPFHIEKIIALLRRKI